MSLHSNMSLNLINSFVQERREFYGSYDKKIKTKENEIEALKSKIESEKQEFWAGKCLEVINNSKISTAWLSISAGTLFFATGPILNLTGLTHLDRYLICAGSCGILSLMTVKALGLHKEITRIKHESKITQLQNERDQIEDEYNDLEDLHNEDDKIVKLMMESHKLIE